VEAALAGVNGEELAPALGVAAQFLRTTTPDAELSSRLPGGRVERILELVEGLDHVGFLAPEELAADLPAAAAAAGFDIDQHSFDSTILARHLAELAQRDEVPTSIFKARGSFTDAGSVAVEVAMPSGVARTLLRDWMSRGIGTHVAFRVSSPECFGELRRELAASGYRMPGFAKGGSLRNEMEGIEAVFFDRRPADPVGLEFCHYQGRGSQSPAS
jgi:hypothetical protein